MKYNIKNEGGPVVDGQAGTDPNQPQQAAKETKETTIIKASGQSAITSILQVNISLQANKNAQGTVGPGRKTEEGPGTPSGSGRRGRGGRGVLRETPVEDAHVAAVREGGL